MDTFGQIQSLIECIVGGSRDMFRGVFEIMFQAIFEYPWLDDKEVSFLNFIPMLREGLDIAWSINHPASGLLKNVNEG